MDCRRVNSEALVRWSSRVRRECFLMVKMAMFGCDALVSPVLDHWTDVWTCREKGSWCSCTILMYYAQKPRISSGPKCGVPCDPDWRSERHLRRHLLQFQRSCVRRLIAPVIEETFFRCSSDVPCSGYAHIATHRDSCNISSTADAWAKQQPFCTPLHNHLKRSDVKFKAHPAIMFQPPRLSQVSCRSGAWLVMCQEANNILRRVPPRSR